MAGGTGLSVLALAPCALLRHMAGVELLTHGGINSASAEQALNQQLWVRKGREKKVWVCSGFCFGETVCETLVW